MTTPESGNTPDEASAQGQQSTGGSPEPQTKQTDWVAEARKWEERAKENKKIADQNSAAAKRLSELEESQKTELQKIQERAEAAEKRAADLEAADEKRRADEELKKQIEDWKSQVSKATGVPASALRGTTKEDLQAHAEVIKALLPDPNTRRAAGAYVPSEGRGSSGGGSDPEAEFGRILQNAMLQK